MIPAAFDYVRAESAEEAISLIGQHGDESKFLAGGHSLLPLMKLRLAQPTVLIDIGRLSDLSYIRDAGDHIAIGAMTRHMDVETSPVLAEHVPLLAHAASHVGDPQVRHRGTIGGSIAHSDSASDLPATTLALPRARLPRRMSATSQRVHTFGIEIRQSCGELLVPKRRGKSRNSKRVQAIQSSIHHGLPAISLWLCQYAISASLS